MSDGLRLRRADGVNQYTRSIYCRRAGGLDDFDHIGGRSCKFRCRILALLASVVEDHRLHTGDGNVGLSMIISGRT
jgi:hypothetical protein